MVHDVSRSTQAQQRAPLLQVRDDRRNVLNGQSLDSAPEHPFHGGDLLAVLHVGVVGTVALLKARFPLRAE
eukprot:1083123-Pyramimonas_sp.AAC.1